MNEEERYEAFRATLERSYRLRSLRERVDMIRSQGRGASMTQSAVIWALLDYIKDDEVTAIVLGKGGR